MATEEQQPEELTPEERHKRALNDDNIRLEFMLRIEAGNEEGDAAADTGFSPQTAYRWMKRGEDGRARGVRNKYTRFLDELEVARRRGRARLVAVVANEAEDDARLAMDVLKLWDPGRWNPDVAQVIRGERLELLRAIKTEFANEPQTLARFLSAVARGRSPLGAGESVEASPGPPGAATVTVPRGPAQLHPGAEPTVPPASPPAAPGESAGEDQPG